MLSLTAIPVFAKINANITTQDIELSNKTNSIKNEFDQSLYIKYNKSISDEALNTQITNLSKKVTYLVLGSPNDNNYTEYINRKSELLKLRYAPSIPKNNDGSLNKNSQEYKDDTISGINIPGMFKLLSEKNIIYKDFGVSKIFTVDDKIYVSTNITDISIEKSDDNEPRKIDRISTNLGLNYVFKKVGSDYKLYYIGAETDENQSDFLKKLSEQELASSYKNNKFIPDGTSGFDFGKLKALPDNAINQVLNDNINSVVTINGLGSSGNVHSGVGFFIDDSVLMTSWSLLDNLLTNASDIIATNNKGEVYRFDGIISISPELDLAVLKTKNSVKSSIKFPAGNNMTANEPIISLSSKSGFGLSVTAGIVAKQYSNTTESVLPSTVEDMGSPLFNSNGEIIGMAVSQPATSNFLTSINSSYIKQFKDKLANTNITNIKNISFSTIKDKYYLKNIKKEPAVDSLTKNQWDAIGKICKIKENLALELSRAHYKDGIYGLRYKKSINESLSKSSIKIFKSSLIRDNYKLDFENASKEVYKNEDNKKQLTIIDEGDYIIVIISKF